jgi:proteasome accessory factor B
VQPGGISAELRRQTAPETQVGKNNSGRRARKGSSGGRPDERVLQLLSLLLHAGRGLSRAEIFEAIAAYRRDKKASGERMFERDKKDLREVGVAMGESEGETHLYSIDRRSFELPPLSLEEDERAALVLSAQALRAWRGLGYRDLVEEALRKLSFDGPGHGPGPEGGRLAVALPSVSAGPRVCKRVSELATAVERRKRVTIGYRTETGETTRRVIDPHALVYARGEWRLVGHCHSRKDTRTFRVDRIQSLVVAGKPGTPDFDPPANQATAHVPRSPWLFGSGEVEVVLDIAPERGWVTDEDFGSDAIRETLAATSPGENSWTRVRFRTGNLDYVVTRVLDGAGRIRVVAPPELVRKIHETATAVAALYPEAAS